MRQFVANFGKGVGDFVTLHLPAPAQSAQGGYDPPERAASRPARSGCASSAWSARLVLTPTSPACPVVCSASPALFARYRVNFIGTAGLPAINALVRLKAGEAAIPAFSADLARVSGRRTSTCGTTMTDTGVPARRITGYEAACLLAFAAAALVAAFFLVGQSVARYTSATVPDLQVLQAVGMTSAAGRRVGFGAAVPGGGGGGHARCRRCDLGLPVDADRCGVAAGAGPGGRTPTGWCWASAGPSRRCWCWPGRPAAAATHRRGRPAAGAATPVRRRGRGGGRGRAAGADGDGHPVRPGARAGPVRRAGPARRGGAIVGVLGMLAAFTFSAGMSDAAAHPVRFGQTSQLEAFFGFNGPISASRRVLGCHCR